MLRDFLESHSRAMSATPAPTPLGPRPPPDLIDRSRISASGQKPACQLHLGRDGPSTGGCPRQMVTNFYLQFGPLLQVVAPASCSLRDELPRYRSLTVHMSATGRISTRQPYSRPGHCFAISTASSRFLT